MFLHEENKGNVYATNCEDKVIRPSISSQTYKFNKNVTVDSASHGFQINSSASFKNSKSISFLPTTNVILHDRVGKAFPFRGLLDSGSECSFVKENVINLLNLKRKNDRIILNGIAGVKAGETRGSVTLTVGSKVSDESINVQACILPRVASQSPTELLDTKNADHSKNISFGWWWFHET